MSEKEIQKCLDESNKRVKENDKRAREAIAKLKILL